MYNDEFIGTYMDRVITTTEVPQQDKNWNGDISDPAVETSGDISDPTTILAQGSETIVVNAPAPQLQTIEKIVEVSQIQPFETVDHSNQEELNSGEELRGTGDRNDRSTSQRLTAQLRVGGAPTLAKKSQQLGRTIQRAKVTPVEPPHQNPPTLLKQSGRRVKSVSSQTFKDKYLGKRLVIIDTGSSSNANNSQLVKNSLKHFIQETEFKQECDTANGISETSAGIRVQIGTLGWTM